MDKKKIPLKYLIGFTEGRETKLDLLYEIAAFLDKENKTEFTETEVKTKTKSRFGTLEENMEALIQDGYIERVKTRYKLMSTPWS